MRYDRVPPPLAPSGDGAAAPAPRTGAAPRLPASFAGILAEVDPHLEGEDRFRWLADRVARLPQADRDEARAAHRVFVRQMVELEASDLDLGGPACAGRVWFRVHGFKRPEEELGSYSVDETDLLLLAVLNHTQVDRLLRNFAVDFGYELPAENDGEPPRRFRVTVYVDHLHLALCQRMLAWKPRSLRSLGFHPLVEQGFLFSRVRDGITLFTGVTGSGKSTSLDAIIDTNNEEFDGHILIVAQPLEYIHASKRCIVRHREVGTDVASFVDGMVQGLRQDPDIVVVGEMRDAETISTALEMADTGHKVFSTLHTGSAVESIDRIVAEYPPVEQERVRHRLADVLRCIVSQKLLPSIGGGRVLAKEVLWVTSPVRAAIKNGNTHEIYQMIWQGTDQGMITLEQDLARLVQLGDVTMDTAVDFANNKRRFLSLLR
jgi:twitching motility protein PilT